MSKAYLNALAEEGTRQELIDWLVKKDAEVDALEAQNRKAIEVLRSGGGRTAAIKVLEGKIA